MPWVRVTPDPNDPSKMVQVPSGPPFSFSNLWSGYKTYLVVAVAIAKIWYPIFTGHPWSPEVDNALNLTLLALGVATVRSGINTATAQIANAVVSPGGPAAKALAAKAPGGLPAA